MRRMDTPFAVFTTKDASVPLAARDKYLQGLKVIGFTRHRL